MPFMSRMTGTCENAQWASVQDTSCFSVQGPNTLDIFGTAGDLNMLLTEDPVERLFNGPPPNTEKNSSLDKTHTGENRAVKSNET